MSRDAITRRQLIRAAAAGALTLPVAAIWPARRAAAGDAAPPAPEVWSRVARNTELHYGPDSRAALRRVGGHYLAALERAGLGEAERRVTLADSVRALTATRGKAFDAAVGARTTEDFLGGAIVDLGGWVLSATEVELCAVVALETQPTASGED